jgi:hypothetical protein
VADRNHVRSALILDLPGKPEQRLAVAEEFVMGGQQLPWTTLGETSYQPFEQQCRAQPFLVNSIRPAD